MIEKKMVCKSPPPLLPLCAKSRTVCFSLVITGHHLQIQTRIIGKPYDLSFTPNLQFDDVASVNDGSQMSYTLTDLKPSTEYEVKVSAHSSNGKGDGAILKLFTLPATAKGKNILKDKIFFHMNSTVELSVPIKLTCTSCLGFHIYRVVRTLVCMYIHTQEKLNFLAQYLPSIWHERAARLRHRVMLLRLAHYKRNFYLANISDRFDWPTASATLTCPIQAAARNGPHLAA